MTEILMSRLLSPMILLMSSSLQKRHAPYFSGEKILLGNDLKNDEVDVVNSDVYLATINDVVDTRVCAGVVDGADFFVGELA